MDEKHNEEKPPVATDQAGDAKPTETRETAASSGLDENVAGLLCYLGGVMTGIIFILIEKENRFVRFHALQSIFTFGILFVVYIVLTALPVIGWMIGLILAPLSVIVWIVLMIKAYQGRQWKLPVVGDMADKQLDKMST
ncbi:DUF4870 domain-containing protein [Alteribacillus iranensis]|uniref:Uncharacterized membrane protein n=1 Tax=Alteribacillus iranensis TaxID=930128 RepID=A0A1I2BT58_9BACI|nr:DUF4870 domain-containing protein [Alteribacillus iranensis]SFE59259.1 Uncharacterized membrane protein [Alteribacillus iranensis]